MRQILNRYSGSILLGVFIVAVLTIPWLADVILWSAGVVD